MEQSDCIVFECLQHGRVHPWVPVADEAKPETGPNSPRRPTLYPHQRDGDLYAPIRAGSDIAFLGGLINHESIASGGTRTRSSASTSSINNACCIVRDDFKGTEELDGVFSGLMEYEKNPADWPYDGFVGQYQTDSWQYARQRDEYGQPRGAEENAAPGRKEAQDRLPPDQSLASVIRSLRRPPPLRDETLRNPRCVFQLVKRHFSRYTPEMVEQVTGCPQDTFTRWRHYLENSGLERTNSLPTPYLYQHTNGPR